MSAMFTSRRKRRMSESSVASWLKVPHSCGRRSRWIFLALSSLSVFILLRAMLFAPKLPTFVPALDPRPVHHTASLIEFDNHPVSIHRPRNQFVGRRASPSSRTQPPIVTVFTVTHNPRVEPLLETYECLHQQSLQSFRWLIINDHTTDRESLAALYRLAALDSRIVIVDNDGHSGVTNARNKAIEVALSYTDTPYISALDDDDLLELTTLEKAIWMLESNKEWDLASFYWVKFGAQNVTEVNGVHLGAANYYSENYVANSAVYRASAVGECRYDESFSKGGEDWDFWLCMAEAGHWGGTLPELAYWYRVNPSKFRAGRWGNSFTEGLATLKQRVQAKHRHLDHPGAFPALNARRSVALEPISWVPPLHNLIQGHPSKAIMFVVPWLYVGGADIGALHMVQIFAERGYRVTVVCTLFKNPQGIELRPHVMQWTHDLHILPSFLRANDFPRFMKYLIRSRGIEHVVMSNSQLMYELLPALAEQLPQVKFIDYLHNEAYDGWKSGGYPMYSIITQRYLARTVTCSSHLREWAIERGHAADRIGVVRLGIEISDFTPTNATAREKAKRDLLNIGPDTIVITIVARLDPQKRPIMVPDIADNLRRRGATGFVIVMLGDGDSATELKERINSFRVGSLIRVMGTVARPQDFLAATDIFLLPSVSEGISIAVAEAMAMGLPIVTARAGALPEQLGANLISSKTGRAQPAGVLVNHTLVDEVDATMYAGELHRLLVNPGLRRSLGARARQIVEGTFDWHHTLLGMFEQIKLSTVPKLHDAALPNPAAQFAIEKLLIEANPETDFAAFQTTLKAPTRDGVGKVLQERCGEATEAMTGWIDSMEQPRSCSGSKLQNRNLQRSAKFQCGAWCIFDLTNRNMAGWSYNGNCFTELNDKSWCKDFWSSRPMIQLTLEDEDLGSGEGEEEEEE